MEKQKYVLGFTVICKDGSRIHETATTYEEDGLVNAENNVAWRYVVKDNPKAKYAGGIIRFDSGREIDGSKRSNKKPLYLLLKEDLLANGIVISIERAKKLRAQFHMTNKNYSDVVSKVINFVKEEENMGNIEKAVETEVKVESTNAEVNKEEENMEIKTLYKDVDRTDKKVVRKISNQVLSMIIDKKTNDEKHLFSKVFNILYDSGAYMDIAEEDDKITVLFGDSGIVIPTKSAIDFAREIYLEVQDPEWIDAKNAAAIRARLTDLFKPASAKQKTTDTSNVKPVENKVALANDKQKEEKDMKIIVTGIGSREIDETGKARVTEIAKMMDAKGFILRSGGAPGADTVFEANMSQKEIYLPWKGFGEREGREATSFDIVGVDSKAINIAKEIHPHWNAVTSGGAKLLGRDVYQVLGATLDMPSSLCVCWTKDGAKTEKESSKATGGSRTAIVLADRNHIPVFNLKLDADYEALKKILVSDNMPFKVATKQKSVRPIETAKKEERNMTIEDLCENAINAAAKTPDHFNKNTTILVGVKAVNKEDKSIFDVKVGLNIRLWQDKENENFFRGKLFTPKGVEIGKVFWDIQKPYLPMLKKTGETKYGTYMYKCSNELNIDFTDPNALAAWNRNQMILAVAKAFNQFGIHAKNTSGRTANVTTCYKEMPTVQTTSSTAATPPVQGNPWAAYIK